MAPKLRGAQFFFALSRLEQKINKCVGKGGHYIEQLVIEWWDERGLIENRHPEGFHVVVPGSLRVDFSTHLQ